MQGKVGIIYLKLGDEPGKTVFSRPTRGNFTFFQLSTVVKYIWERTSTWGRAGLCHPLAQLKS